MPLQFKVQNSKFKIAIQSSKVFNTFKFLLALLTFNFLLLTFPVPVHAQTATTSAIPAYVSPISPLYTDLMVHNLFHSFSCLAIGQSVIGQPCLSYLQGVPVLSKTNTSGGVLGATTSIIGMLYTNPPVRTADYIGSLNFGIVKPANAQVIGSGAAVLSPILKLWQVSRNISYVFMIIIFVIIGIMIMFRHKINPQTVITAQAALPGLVIGLIMITFSYFLAGLISDMAFVGTNVVGYYFSAVKPPSNPPVPPQNLVNDMTNTNAITVMGQMLNGIHRDPIGDGIQSFLDNLPDPAGRYVRAGIVLISYQVGSTFGPGLGAIAGMAVCGAASLPFLTIPGINLVAMGGVAAAIPVCATAGGAIGGPVVGATVAVNAVRDPASQVSLALWFLAMIVILYAIFRLLMRLINCFLTIIFLVITAPFQFLLAALPGRQGIATNWILNLLGNVLVFPAVLAVLYFVAFILGESFGPLRVTASNQNHDNGFMPVVYAEEKNNGIIGSATFPLFGGMNLGFINILLAFGALVALPVIPDIIVKSVGKAGQAGQMIGQEISSGIAGGQKYYGRAQGGLGAIEKDTGALGKFSSQREYIYDSEGKEIVQRRIIPGLGSKFHPPVSSVGGAPKPIKP